MGKATLSYLLELSDQLIKDGADSSDIIFALERYSETFSSWLEMQSSPIQTQSEEERESLRKLASQHGQILELASKMKDQTVEDLKELEVRGKAIMAYVDQAPKSISQLGVKKG